MIKLSLAPHPFTRKTKQQYIINQSNTHFINHVIITEIKPSCFRVENESSDLADFFQYLLFAWKKLYAKI